MKKILWLTTLGAIFILGYFVFNEFVFPLLKPSTGQLSVTVKNQKAVVFLDEKEIGKSPFYANNLRVGDHILEIGREDGKGARFRTNTTLSQETLSLLDIDLAPNLNFTSGESLYFRPGESGLAIDSKPSATSISINGGEETKLPLNKTLSPGVHVLTLKKEGYLPREVTVNIVVGFKLNATIYLATDPFETTVKLDSGSKASLYGLANKYIDLDKNPENWIEGIKHIQESLPNTQTRFDAALDQNGKLYIFNQTQWDNKLSSKSAVNLAYLGSKQTTTPTAAAQTEWLKTKALFE